MILEDKEELKMKLKGNIIVKSIIAPNPTGIFKSTENSLNQHIKLKHPKFWTKIKFETKNKEDLEGE